MYKGWLLVAISTLTACSRNEEPPAVLHEEQMAHVDSQTVPILLGNAPIQIVEQQFTLADPRSMSNGVVQLATMGDRPEVVSLLEAAWRLDKTSKPRFNWSVIESPTVRLALAQVLGQWAKDKSEYRTAIKGYLNSADVMTRMDAVIALGAVADDEDIKTLAEYARGSNEVLAISAVGTLKSMGTPRAIAIVQSIANDSTVPPSVREQAKATSPMSSTPPAK